MIIGITGLKNAGKDTAAQYLIDKYDFERVAFADTLKQAAAALFDVKPSYIENNKNDISFRVQLVKHYNSPGLKNATEYKSEMSLRQFLQRMGTEMGREVFGSLFWVDQLDKKIDLHKNYVIPDVRFDNETTICDIIIEVHRPTVRTGDPHASEQGVSDDLIDFIVKNDGTVEDLHRKVEACLTEALSKTSFALSTKSAH
jgi:Deoxynucleotide monophosphate kinase